MSGPLIVTKPQLHAFLVAFDPETRAVMEDYLEDNEVLQSIDEVDRLWLCQLDFCLIMADTEVSEHHLGGDDLVEIADDVLGAITKGYTLVTWYGPECECLIVGIRPHELVVVDA